MATVYRVRDVNFKSALLAASPPDVREVDDLPGRLFKIGAVPLMWGRSPIF